MRYHETNVFHTNLGALFYIKNTFNMRSGNVNFPKNGLAWFQSGSIGKKVNNALFQRKSNELHVNVLKTSLYEETSESTLCLTSRDKTHTALAKLTLKGFTVFKSVTMLQKCPRYLPSVTQLQDYRPIWNIRTCFVKSFCHLQSYTFSSVWPAACVWQCLWEFSWGVKMIR